MLDRTPSKHIGAATPLDVPRPRWPFAFVACSGLIGAAGVAVGALGAHGGGGDVARTASDVLMIHAAAILGASGVALSPARPSAFLVASMGLLTVGAILFGGELAAASLAGWRPIPLAAPTGGLCLIAGWLGLAVAGCRLALRRG